MSITRFKSLAFLALVLSQLGCSTPHHEYSEKFAKGEPKPNEFWWPERLDLQPLRQHAAESSPMGENFNYAKEFKKLDLKVVKQDIEKLMKT